VGGGLGAQLSLVQGFPLAARPQDIEDGIGTLAVRYPSTAQSWSEMRYPVVVRLFGVRARVRPGFVGPLIPLRISGYSDRHLDAA
jgi:hypothetical protein